MSRVLDWLVMDYAKAKIAADIRIPAKGREALIRAVCAIAIFSTFRFVTQSRCSAMCSMSMT